MSQPIALDKRNITAGWDAKTKLLTVVAIVPDGTVPNIIARIGFEREEMRGGRHLKLVGYPDGPANASRRIQVNPYTESITEQPRFTGIWVETDKGSETQDMYSIALGSSTPTPGPTTGPLPAKTPSSGGASGGTIPPPSSGQLLPFAVGDISATYERDSQAVGAGGTIKVVADGIVPTSILGAAFELDKSYTGVGRRLRLVGYYGGLGSTKGMQRLQATPYTEKIDSRRNRGDLLVITSQGEYPIPITLFLAGDMTGDLDMPANQGNPTLDSSTTRLPAIACTLYEKCYARITAPIPDFQAVLYEIEARPTSDTLRVWRAGTLATKMYWDVTWTKGDPGKPADFIVTVKTWPVGTDGKKQVTVQLYTATFKKNPNRDLTDRSV